MPGDNRNMAVAKQAKNDEFYTMLEDVEAEMCHYTAHFKGARVLCNCDDPFASAFVRYFVDNFDRLGPKGLVSTCWSGGRRQGVPGGDNACTGGGHGHGRPSCCIREQSAGAVRGRGFPL